MEPTKELETREINVVPESALMNEEDLENAIKKAERMETLVRKIKTLAIKQTNPQDWVDMQGKPYLQSSGAEKIARMFGISWRICEGYPKKDTIQDEKGSYYMYSFKGEFTMGGKSIEIIGTCSQKDKLLGTTKDKEKNKILKPASEIDETSIIKKANTNMIVRGITTILGIRNLTWDEVNNGGVDQNKTNKVVYQTEKEITGIIKEITGKTGKSKTTGKEYTVHTITVETPSGMKVIKTFDNPEGLAKEVEIKAIELTAKTYNGTNYYEAKKIEILSDAIETGE